MSMRGMAANENTWNLDARYPADANFPALLTWHLRWNGTRPEGQPDKPGIAWTDAEFADSVDGGLQAQPESKDKKVRRWREGKNNPDQSAIRRIEYALFGSNAAYERWQYDLRCAWYMYVPPRRKSATAQKPNERFADSPDAATIERELGLRRDLLEAVAMRFGHDSPDAPDEVLLGFIKEKGREYKAIKAELADITEPDARLQEAHKLADELIADGKFVEADALLCQAEEYYKYAKLAFSVAIQAETRRKRVQTAFHLGDVREAYEHFETMSALYGTVHPDMEEIHRVMFAMVLLTMDPPPSDLGQDLAIKLLEPIIEHYRLCYMYGMGTEIGFGETRVNRLLLLSLVMHAPKVAAFVAEET